MIPIIFEMLAASAGNSGGPSLTVGLSASPYAKVFIDGDDEFSELTGYFSTSPGAAVNTARFSPLGDLLAVGNASSPYIRFFDNGAKLDDPASLPAGTVNDVAWSPDGTYCAVAHNSSPYLTIYKRSGGSIDKLPNPGSLPTSNALGVAFSDDGTYLAVITISTPFIKYYKRSGDTFTAQAQPATIPANTPTVCSWAPGGAYLAVTFRDSPYFLIYKRTGDALSESGVTVPTITASLAAFALSWSADGTYLAMGSDQSPYLIVLKRTSDAFAKLSNPGTLPGSTVIAASFSESDRIALRVGNAAQLYSLTADVLAQVTGHGLPSSNVTTVSFYPPAVPGSP